MFEREFYDSDLDKIESEKEFLERKLDEFTNFKSELDEFIKLADRVIEACDKNSVCDFLKSCDELEKLDNYHHSPMSYIVENFFSQIYQIKKNLDKELQEYSLTLNRLVNKIKNFDKFILKIEKLLDEEKKLIFANKKSVNLNEKSKLYRQFLEKEKQIYEIYLKNFHIENNDFTLSHTHNAIKFDIKQFFKKIKSLDLFVVSSIPLLGFLLVFPYFFMINEFPQVGINNALITIFGVFIFLVLFNFIIYENYLIFNVVENKKIIYGFFVIYHIILLVMLSPFFLEKIFKNYANFIYKYFNIFIFVCFVIIILFTLYHLSRQHKYKIANALLFVVFLIFDYVFVSFVYFRADDLEPFMTMLFCGLIFPLRFISIGKIFDYKSQIIMLMFLLTVSSGFFSGEFVRMARLGNYSDDFIVKTKFVPQYILDANLTNCGARNTTCIEKFDESLTKFTNLKVIVVLDKKYKVTINPKFECKFKDDNKTATCSINDFKSSADIDRANLDCKSNILHHKCRYKEFTIYKENIAG